MQFSSHMITNLDLAFRYIRAKNAGNTLTCTRELKIPSRPTGRVYFEPGSWTPVAVGDDYGMCLLRKQPDGVSANDYRDRCSDTTMTNEHNIWLHGFAWKDETPAKLSPDQLSSRRISVVRDHLRETDRHLHETETFSHGTSRTPVPRHGDQPLIGVFFTVGEGAPFAAPKWQVARVSVDSQNRLDPIYSFLEQTPMPNPAQSHCTNGFFDIKYRLQDKELSGEFYCPYGDKSRPAALLEWTETLVRNRCQLSPTGYPQDYYTPPDSNWLPGY